MKNKLFGVINIAGLTIGATCFLIILMYAFSQNQYDKHHEAGPSLYRVESELIRSEGNWMSSTISPPIVPMMANDFPEVVNYTRVVDPPETSHHILKIKNNAYFETEGYYVDSTFFQMFDYDFIEGRAEDALQEPYTVVLTKKVKNKLFGRQDALGKTIQINNRFGNNAFKVTGVVDPSTYKSHIHPNFYMSMNSGGIGEYVIQNNQWAGGNFIYGYVELHPSANTESLLSKLPAFLQKYGANQFKEFGIEKILTLQSVPEIHLYSTRSPGQSDNTARVSSLKILLLIAGFILIIACVNFMNLATAKSLKKGVEVGVRKTIGANRSSIAKQFYIESFFVSGISILMALLLTYLLLPWISNFVQEQISINLSVLPFLLLSVFGICLLTGFIAGSYPAIYLSSFKPIAIIKSHVMKNRKQELTRKSLVVLQFSISITMIIGSMIILNQLNFMQQKDLGFDQEQKIVVPFRTSDSREKLLEFKNQTLTMSDVKNAAGARIYPGQFMPQDFNVYSEGNDMNNSNNVKLIQGDEDYLKTLGIPILHGRNFTPSDTALQILINQAGLRTFNIPENEAVGQKLFSEYQNETTTYEIIGVVKDFHQVSLKEVIRPIIFEYSPTERNLAIVVDASVANSQGLVTSLESTWNELIPQTPFEYSFLNDHIQKQYVHEMRLAETINWFTFIAIFISCLGLFGLSVFVAEQRMKEIGIRKVLGATTTGLVTLLSKDFIKLICLALFIATPIAWYLMKGWLEGFAYRIDMQWWMFLLAGAGAIVIGLLTVGFNSLKAALTNPVNSLKGE